MVFQRFSETGIPAPAMPSGLAALVHAIERPQYCLVRALFHPFLGRLAKTGERFVAEPDDRPALIAGKLGCARDDARNFSELGLHGSAGGMRRHRVAIEVGDPRQARHRQSQALRHAARCDQVAVTNIIYKSSKHACTSSLLYAPICLSASHFNDADDQLAFSGPMLLKQLGRASFREKVCQYG